MNRRQHAAHRGYVKRLQRASQANYADLERYREGLHMVPDIHHSLVSGMLYFQAEHARNSALARDRLFRIIGEKP